MKILMVAWAIYDSRLEQFERNCTGGGIVIKNLAEELSKMADVYLLIGQFFLPRMKLGEINIIDTMPGSSQKEIFETNKEKKKEYLVKVFEQTVKRIVPDVVSFQGVGEFAYECMRICIKNKLRFTYTEHLFIRRDHKINKDCSTTLSWQSSIYSLPDIHIIAVSSNMKQNIINDYPTISEKNIKVILNGTDFVAEHINSDVIDRCHMKGRKILLCVGNICERKNQLLLIQTFKLLPKDIKPKIGIVFLGKDRMKGVLSRRILEEGLEDALLYSGSVASEQMKEYYSVADGLIMPSLCEGLSIAALEAIRYGMPVIMSAESECAGDLDDEKVVVFAEQNTPDHFADAIIRWKEVDWEKKYIQCYSERFSIARMANEYCEYFKEL